MPIKAWLDGAKFDLELLASLFRTGDVRVISEDGRFHLTASALDERAFDGKYYEVAPTLLTSVNALGRVASADFRPVRLTDTYSDGNHNHTVVRPETIEVRAHVYAAAVLIDGREPPSGQGPDASARMTLADTNPAVADVFQLFGSPASLNWVELYKVYEIVRHTGRLETSRSAAGVSRDAIRLFTRTANHQDAGGPDARHARMREPPPAAPMPIAEARALIGRLVDAWLDVLDDPAGD